MDKAYNYIFNNLYKKDIHISTGNNHTLIDSIIRFYKKEKSNIDFKKDKLRLKEAVDSSYELSAFPVLTVSFTVMYAISIYSNNTDINLFIFKDVVIFIILELVLLLTLIYIFTFFYYKMKVSLCNLCINIINEYRLDQ